MKRYFIENAKCGFTDGGFACGPVDGNVVVTVQFKEDKKTQYLSVVEVSGIPNYYLSDEDIFDDLVKEDFDDTEFQAVMDASYITDFNGIEFGCEYSDIFESISEDINNPIVPLLRYVIALLRCPMEDVESLVKMASGKYADEIEIPTSDIEEEYMDELEDEENGDDDETKFIPPENREVIAILSEHNEHGTIVDPILPCGEDEESAILLADEMWNEIPDEEKEKYKEYKLVYTKRQWSEIIGFVYSGDGKVIKTYI